MVRKNKPVKLPDGMSVRCLGERGNGKIKLHIKIEADDFKYYGGKHPLLLDDAEIKHELQMDNLIENFTEALKREFVKEYDLAEFDYSLSTGCSFYLRKGPSYDG